MTLASMIQLDTEEARRVRAFLDGDDISPESRRGPRSPIWLAPGRPSYYGATLLADSFGIERLSTIVTAASHVINGERRYTFQAVVTAEMDGSTRLGAAVHEDRSVAVELAFRNAVRLLIAGHL